MLLQGLRVKEKLNLHVQHAGRELQGLQRATITCNSQQVSLPPALPGDPRAPSVIGILHVLQAVPPPSVLA